MWKRWYIFCFIALLSIVMLVGMVFKLREYGQSVAETQMQIQTMEEKYGELMAFQEENPNLDIYKLQQEKIYKETNQLLPDSLDLPEVMVMLENMASVSGISLQEIIPLEPVKHENYLVQPLRININGGYFGLLDYLRLLRKAPRYIQVLALDIQGEELLEGKLTLAVYTEKIN